MLTEERILDEVRIRPSDSGNHKVIVIYANHIKRDGEILMTELSENAYNLDYLPSYLDESFSKEIQQIISRIPK